jgi:hypothetical protein
MSAAARRLVANLETKSHHGTRLALSGTRNVLVSNQENDPKVN